VESYEPEPEPQASPEPKAEPVKLSADELRHADLVGSIRSLEQSLQENDRSSRYGIVRDERGRAVGLVLDFELEKQRRQPAEPQPAGLLSPSEEPNDAA
jgi:hypothetical protein